LLSLRRTRRLARRRNSSSWTDLLHTGK
jgi:hypothetical protein